MEDVNCEAQHDINQQTPAKGLDPNETSAVDEFSTPFSTPHHLAGDVRSSEDLKALERYEAQRHKEIAFTRMSLYRQFDPLATPCAQANMSLGKASSARPTPVNAAEEQAESRGMSFTSMQTPALMNFNTPMVPKSGRRDANNFDPYTPSHVFLASAKPDVLMSATNDKADEMIKLLRLQETALQDEIRMKNDEIETFRSRCKEYKSLLESLTSAAATMMQSFEGKLKDRESENASLVQKCNILLREKEQAFEDVQGVEQSFSELHRRYEKLKGALELSKTNEEILQSHYLEIQEKLKDKEAMYEALKSKAEENVQNANVIIEDTRKANEREITVLRAQLKKAEMKITGLQGQVDQKNHENAELTQMVDELTRLKC